MAAISGPISLDRLQVIAALEAAITDIETRKERYDEYSIKYPKLKSDWNKKVSSLIKKEGVPRTHSSAPETSYEGVDGGRTYYASQTLYVHDSNPAYAKLLKEKPEEPRKVYEIDPPRVYGKAPTPAILEDLRTAVKMYKMSTDTNIKVSVKTSWMHYIK